MVEFKDIYYKPKPKRSYGFFEFVIRFDESTGITGRIIFELFNDIVPKTVKNFTRLCTGVLGPSKHYGNNIPFHQIIKGFAVQGGDIENGDGTGGSSIYGPTFPDENFIVKHDAPYYLSMANRGPNTNGSQFFITLTAAPELDGKHVVFGKVIGGKSFLRALEVVATDDNDTPLYPILVHKSGLYQSDHPIRVRPQDDGTGDLFEKYIYDEPLVDIHDSDSVFNVVSAIKEIGTKQFKEGNNLKALEKYRKASNYLEDYFPDDLSDEDFARFKDLKISLYLNVALTSIKLGVGDTAIKAASEALDMEGLSDREKAKAYYRRGNGYLLARNEEDALADLIKAQSYAPHDAAIVALGKKAYQARAQRKQRQKAAMSKLFSPDNQPGGIFS